MAGEHAGHRQRMRERFLESGLDGFADHEIIELILCYAIPQRNVNPLAHRLTERFGTLHGVLDAPVEELMKVEGVGLYAATLMQLFSQVSRSLEKSRCAQRAKLATYGDVRRHCHALLSGLRKEHFYVVCLDAQKQILRDVLISTGSISEVQAYPRVVVEAALRHNAHSVILCHNHPSGSAIPSQGDMDVTRKLFTLLEGIEVLLLDHVVVAEGDVISMIDCGLIVFGQDTKRMRVADSGTEIRIRHMLEQKEKIKRK